MADSVLFIGWNRPIVSREQEAMNLFGKSIAYYTKLQTDGRIESFEPVILDSHGGDLNGFIILKGDADKLADIRRDDAFRDLIIEAGYCLEGFGVIGGFIGEGVTDVLSRWSKLLGG